MLVKRGVRGKMLEIVFSGKILWYFILFYPKTFKSSCCSPRKAILILVIAELNCMAQINKSFVIATVVAI